MWQTIEKVADQQGYTGLKRGLFMVIGPVIYSVAVVCGFVKGYIIGVCKSLKKS